MNKVFCNLSFILSSKFGVYFMLTPYANLEEPYLKFLVAFHGQGLL